MRVAAGVSRRAVSLSSSASAQTSYPALEQEPACQTLMPAAAGGPLPRNPDVVVLRFLGVSNYELAYRDNVILLDAAVDKLSWWAPNNITTDEMIKHVNAIPDRSRAWRAPLGRAVHRREDRRARGRRSDLDALDSRDRARRRQEDGCRERAWRRDLQVQRLHRRGRAGSSTTSCPMNTCGRIARQPKRSARSRAD